MGGVLNRGTKDKPLWYMRYVDLDGKRKHRPTRQPTKAESLRQLAEVEQRIAKGLVGIPSHAGSPLMGPLIEKWIGSLNNRAAEGEKPSIRKHMLVYFQDTPISDIDVGAALDWIDHLRSSTQLSEWTLRTNLNFLSRFFSWAILRGHASVNPVKQIPQGQRPRPRLNADAQWIDDDSTVRAAMSALAKPFNLIFYLCNRSGLRPGESAGIRLSDLDFLSEGILRIRFQYDGLVLKEDKHGSGAMKWVPAPNDAASVLRDWVAVRKAQGAQPEDLLFVTASGLAFNRQSMRRAWLAVRDKLGLPKMKFYEAGRHSMVSRNLKRQVPLDMVSAAVGHSTPMVTKRFYGHYIRKEFSTTMREGLGITGARVDATVIPITCDQRVSSYDGPNEEHDAHGTNEKGEISLAVLGTSRL